MSEHAVYRLCTKIYGGQVVVVGDTGLTWDGDPIVVVRTLDGGEPFACEQSCLVPIDQALSGWGHA